MASYYGFSDGDAKRICQFRKIKERSIDGKYATLLKNLERFRALRQETLWKNLFQVNCEDCVGDMLVGCSRCYQCYASFNTQDGRYAWDLTPSEKCVSPMDITQGGIGELLYNSQALGGGNYFMRMCIRCRLSSHLTYCIDCYSCKDCLGCTGLRNKQYCIFNTQYPKNEYEDLTKRLVAHMRATGEWGEFYPLSFVQCGYNLSNGQRYFPLTKEEIVRRGWLWEENQEEATRVEGSIPAARLPDAIDDVTDDVLSGVIACEKTKRPFKIMRRELEFYRSMRLPLPRMHPDARMERRFRSCNPFKLWQRNCMRCGTEMQTSFAPERPEKVVCESCYLKEVY